MESQRCRRSILEEFYCVYRVTALNKTLNKSNGKMQIKLHHKIWGRPTCSVHRHHCDNTFKLTMTLWRCSETMTHTLESVLALIWKFHCSIYVFFTGFQMEILLYVLWSIDFSFSFSCSHLWLFPFFCVYAFTHTEFVSSGMKREYRQL